ncbi:hypothetical protein D9M71_589730 [compost metagenome]
MFASRAPHQPRLLAGGEHRHVAGFDPLLQAIALKAGAAAQWHLDEDEVFERLGAHLDFRAITQYQQLAAADRRAEEGGVHGAAAPTQVMVDQFTRQPLPALLGTAAGEYRFAA